MTCVLVGSGALILHLVHTNCAHIRANGLIYLASRMLQYLFFGVHGGFSGWILSEKSVLLVHIVFFFFLFVSYLCDNSSSSIPCHSSLLLNCERNLRSSSSNPSRCHCEECQSHGPAVVRGG